MIRIIIALIGLFLVWLWVASGFARAAKLVISGIAVIASLFLIGLEVYNNKPRVGLVANEEVSNCGLSVQHSYRSDYKVAVCFANKGEHTIRRLRFGITASQCDPLGNCIKLETTERDIPLVWDPGFEQKLNETLRFENVIPSAPDVQWSAEEISVKAVP